MMLMTGNEWAVVRGDWIQITYVLFTSCPPVPFLWPHQSNPAATCTHWSIHWWHRQSDQNTSCDPDASQIPLCSGSDSYRLESTPFSLFSGLADSPCPEPCLICPCPCCSLSQQHTWSSELVLWMERDCVPTEARGPGSGMSLSTSVKTGSHWWRGQHEWDLITSQYQYLSADSTWLNPHSPVE